MTVAAERQRLTSSLEVVGAVSAGVVPEAPASGREEAHIGSGAQDACSGHQPANFKGSACKPCRIPRAGAETGQGGTL